MTQQHFIQHGLENTFKTDTNTPSLIQEHCTVCDEAQIVPQAPAMIVSMVIVSTVERATLLSPRYYSDNPILFPFSARGPPHAC
jgi:hypothetical protein